MTKAEQTRIFFHKYRDPLDGDDSVCLTAMRQHAMEFDIWKAKNGWKYDIMVDGELTYHKYINGEQHTIKHSQLYDLFNQNK